MWERSDERFIRFWSIVLSPVNRLILGILLAAGGIFWVVYLASQNRSSECEGIVIIVLIFGGIILIASYEH